MNTGIMEDARFHSSKITGAGDTERLQTDLATIDGVRSVTVDTNAHEVNVRFDPATIDRNAIQRAVTDAGYAIDSHADETPAGGS